MEDFSLFNKYQQQQATWISGQLKNYKRDSFNDFNKAFEAHEQSLIPLSNKKEIKAFREAYLSEKGISRLKTTLKVCDKRQKDKTRARNLDVTISLDAFRELEKICLKTGLTKRAVIEQFLINSKNVTLI